MRGPVSRGPRQRVRSGSVTRLPRLWPLLFALSASPTSRTPGHRMATRPAVLRLASLMPAHRPMAGAGSRAGTPASRSSPTAACGPSTGAARWATSARWCAACASGARRGLASPRPGSPHLPAGARHAGRPGLPDLRASRRGARSPRAGARARLRGAGLPLLGWGDSGRVRLFSQEPGGAAPADLRRMRPWVPRCDSVFRPCSAASAPPASRSPIGEVFGALRTRMMDVVPAHRHRRGGLAVVHLARARHRAVGRLPGRRDGGARSFLDELSEAEREALFRAPARTTSACSGASVREGDERAYGALLRHGMTEVDVGDHEAEWRRVGEQARARLAGRVFPAALLERVESIAQRTR